MERNALLAVVISLLILVLWNELVLNQYAPEEPAGDAITAPAAPEAAESAPSAPAAPEAPGAPASEADLAPAVDRPTGTDVVVETDRFRAVFTTAGGRLKSLQLNDYRANTSDHSPPEELVHSAPRAPLPLAVHLRGKTGAESDETTLYSADRSQLQLAGAETGSVVFTGEIAGTTVRKRFELKGDSYLWQMDVAIDQPPAFASEVAVTWDGILGAGGGWSTGNGPTANPFNEVLTLAGGDLTHSTRDDLTAGQSFEGATKWTGFSGQYFFAGLITENEEISESASAWAAAVGENAKTMLRVAGQPALTKVILFTGPKDIDLLEDAGHSLISALDLGWFAILGKPMLRTLRFLHGFTGNYGVDIIILTILIKVLFYPLTKKSFQSMKAMQKLQPRMEKLKELYKDKPEELNKAMMELYRNEGVNPLGGCLPMFLQMPVFLGLYNALLNAVELRHAPFAFWIQDLSAPDRLGSLQLPFVTGAGFPVLTLIMGASMLIQQKMTPTTSADPMQQRMMMLMPVVFTFMFINFPAGLTLYWLVNNLLTIGQQYMINRQED